MKRTAHSLADDFGFGQRLLFQLKHVAPDPHFRDPQLLCERTDRQRPFHLQERHNHPSC
ncbi:hypothetical protein D3C86_1962030 [compost metagenome]